MKILGRPALLITSTIAVVWFLPFVSFFNNSIKNGATDNYTAVIKEGILGSGLLNSTIITSLTVFGVLAITSMAAFGFSQLKFPMSKTIYLSLLTGLMLPAGAVLIPFAQINKALGWGNSYPAVVFPYIALFFPLGLLLIKNAFDNLPEEIFNAAAIDGCGLFRMFWSIGLPLASPAVILVALWTFLSTWNEFLIAMLFLNGPSMQPLSVVPLRFQQAYFTDVPKIFAALGLSQIPVLVLYLSTQRHFSYGLLAGTGK